MNITVDSTGKVQNFTDATGNSYTVTYGSNNYISAVTETISGRFVSYQYTNGNLTSVTSPSGITTYFEYDTNNYLTTIKDNQNAVIESLSYVSVTNEPKKINTLTDSFGNVMTYTYVPSENKTVITDGNNRINTQGYDSTKFITSITDAAGRIKTVQYTTIDGKNKYGEISSITNEIGNTTTYQRDINGNITKTTNPDGSYTDCLYDENNNLLWERGSLGEFVLYEYDTQGMKLLKKAKYLNKVTENQTVLLTTENSNLFAIEEYSYYDDSTANIKGLLYRYKNAEGNITEYTYNNHGNPLTVKDPETGLTTTYTYNELNYNLTKTTPRGHTVQYIYDNAGNLVKEINLSNNGVSRKVYDSNGRKVLEINPQQYNSESDSLNVSANVNVYSVASDGTAYEYYTNGLLKKITTTEGDVTEYTYDIYGNVISETIPCQYDETGVKRTSCGKYLYEYDNLNRLTAKKYKETADSDTVLLESISYSQEQSENEYLTIQAVTTYYDGNNSSVVTKKIKYNDGVVYAGYSGGSSETYTYYDDGELKTATDGNGNTTYYKYNSFDSTSGTTYNEVWTPTDGSYAYARTDYDLCGNKVAEYKSSQTVELYSIPNVLYSRNYVYYKNNNLKEESDSEGRKTEYEYDNDSNLTKISVYTDSENKNITEYVNNSIGLPITETKYISSDTIYNDTRTTLTTTIVYDLNGNVVSKTTPDGVTVTTVYDKQNRPILTSQSLTDENNILQSAIVEKKYNSNNDVFYTKDAKVGENHYVYDNRGMCIKEINALGGATLNFYDYAGRHTNIVKPKAYNVAGTLATMDNTEFIYNCKDFVTQKIEHYLESGERNNVVVSQIVYDSNGNVLSETDALGNSTGFTYIPMHDKRMSKQIVNKI